MHFNEYVTNVCTKNLRGFEYLFIPILQFAFLLLMAFRHPIDFCYIYGL